jgi:hypothetical protein
MNEQIYHFNHQKDKRKKQTIKKITNLDKQKRLPIKQTKKVTDLNQPLKKIIDVRDVKRFPI